MSDRLISVKLTLRAPFLFSGLNAPAFGIDSGMIRNAKGDLIVPHSLMRGNLRHVINEMVKAGAQLAEGCAVTDLFGGATTNASEEGSNDHSDFKLDGNGGKVGWAPARGVLEFSDLVQVEKDGEGTRSKASDVLTRIAIDDQTGSVKTGALQVIESPFAVGQCVTFAGTVRVGGVVPVTEVLELLKVAGTLIPAVGANKSSGFGRVEGLKFALAEPAQDMQEKPVQSYAASDFADKADYLIGLQFDRPFLVNSTKMGSNVLKSDVNPSGAVLKGAMANKLKAQGCYDDFADILAEVTVRNAVLLPDGKKAENIYDRPRVIPRSLALSRQGDESDFGYDGFAAADDLSILLDGGGIAFAFDWKREQRSKLCKQLGLATAPKTEIRTRTAINVESGAAAESQLFSEICIVPDGHVWQASLSHDFELGSDQAQKFADMMAVLASGPLEGIGSTRAAASLAVTPVDQSVRKVEAEGKGFWRVTLQSDAVLHPLRAMAEKDAGSASWLRQSYADYWSAIINQWNANNPDKKVELASDSFDFFASQRYAGGYLAARYPLNADKYYPYFLTEAGSVFRFELTGDAEAFLGWLARAGLPAAHDDPDVVQDWRRFPFSPKLGYGEVTVDVFGKELHLEEIG